ncbi:hypothetical protein AXF42_Ash001798 [Apostasia shenzhenica]|uniref:Protein ENDOSPERM DEFECTIVE 1 n=1 Tax=Apostasia shenzhenica TaxID=1088818 RepID=A0A2I0AB88_9ASPA|nr:hypothetical protein AXF42_Ash001798 [Apostasia shenzhenica]
MMIPVPLPSPPASPIHPSSSNSASRTHIQSQKPYRSSSVSFSPDATEFESKYSLRYADENQRNFETPLPLGVLGRGQGTQRQRAVRLFSDNVGDVSQMHIVEHLKSSTEASCKLVRQRLGTPMTCDDGQNHIRLLKKAATEERKSQLLAPFSSLKDGGYSDNSNFSDIAADSASVGSLGRFCSSPPIQNQGSCRPWKASEIRSSLPEADLLPSCSTRKQIEMEESTCRRSLSSALSSSQPSPFNLLKTVNRKTTVPPTPNLGRSCFPLQHPSSRLGLDLKKGKKGLSKYEEYVLFLLQNQYVQWRFVNAKAKLAMKARAFSAEKTLAEVSDKVEDLRNSVADKRIELEMLKRMKNLPTILDAQMPFLEDWALLDGEYSASLLGVTEALNNAAMRLPINGDVKVDIRELKEAIDSVTSIFESLSPSIERFLPNVSLML